MTPLPDHQIRYMRDSGRISIEPYQVELVKPASYDVCIGDQVLHMVRVGKNPVNSRQGGNYLLVTNPANALWVFYPGQFYLANTVEAISLDPDVAAQVEGKSTWGRLGLEVHSTAGWIDPGFSGQITLEIKVVGPCPVVVEVGEPVAQLCFFRMDSSSRKPYGSDNGKYQDQMGATPPPGSRIIKGDGNG